MAKFHGKIGYSLQTEDGHGVWVDDIVEKEHYGDFLQNGIRYQQSSNLNDNIRVSNKISIIADPFAIENFHLAKYVKIKRTKWKISNIELGYPRIIITLGEPYNG